jgi:hypothetical protein
VSPAAPHPLFRVVLAAVLLAGFLATATYAHGEAPRLPNCGTSGYGFKQVRPSAWDPGCTGGSPKFESLIWERWDRTARGHGFAELRVCDPDCVNGYYVRYPARIKAKRVKGCARRPGLRRTRMYTTTVFGFLYPADNPFESPPGWSTYVQPLGCIQ